MLLWLHDAAAQPDRNLVHHCSCSLNITAPPPSHAPGAYNVLMGVLLREVAKGPGISSMLQDGDTTKWLQLAAWLTGYVRLQQVKGGGERGGEGCVYVCQ